MKEGFFDRLADAVIDVRNKHGVGLAELAVGLRVLSDITLAAAGSSVRSLTVTDAVFEQWRPFLLERARAIFKRRGVDLPPESS